MMAGATVIYRHDSSVRTLRNKCKAFLRRRLFLADTDMNAGPARPSRIFHNSASIRHHLASSDILPVILPVRMLYRSGIPQPLIPGRTAGLMGRSKAVDGEARIVISGFLCLRESVFDCSEAHG